MHTQPTHKALVLCLAVLFAVAAVLAPVASAHAAISSDRGSGSWLGEAAVGAGAAGMSAPIRLGAAFFALCALALATGANRRSNVFGQAAAQSTRFTAFPIPLRI
jgi:hypothetical protein